MLSASNLSPLDEARLRFIARGPHYLGPGRPSDPLSTGQGPPLMAS